MHCTSSALDKKTENNLYSLLYANDHVIAQRNNRN